MTDEDLAYLPTEQDRQKEKTSAITAERKGILEWVEKNHENFSIA